jgi:hypothetical protein
MGQRLFSGTVNIVIGMTNDIWNCLPLGDLCLENYELC